MIKGTAEKYDLDELPSLSDVSNIGMYGSHRSLRTECAWIQGPYLVCS